MARHASFFEDPAQPFAPRLTTLTEEQLRAAEMIFSGRDVRDVVAEFAGHNNRRAVTAIQAEQALNQYCRARERARTRPVTVEVARYVLAGFIRAETIATTEDINRPAAERYIFDPKIADRTQKDRRQYLGQWFRWLVKEGYLAADPTRDIEPIKIHGRLPAILTPEQGAELVARAGLERDGTMLGYFAVNLFSGVRPEETKKLTDADLLLDHEEAVIEIAPRVAKVARCRYIPVHDNLARIFARCPRPRIQFFSRAFKAIREKSHVFDAWETDIMRHSYASYHYALHQDIKQLAYVMGNSPEQLFSRYIRPVRKAEARAWFDVA